MAVPAHTIATIESLTRNFFEVVPLKYQTFCALNSRILQRALGHFGIPAQLVPCQIWYSSPERNCVLGFVGRIDTSTRWDGHVICEAGDCFIDAALHHLEADFGVPTPRVVFGKRYPVPSQLIGGYDLNDKERILWVAAPAGVKSDPPEEPADLVAHYADALVKHLGRVDPK